LTCFLVDDIDILNWEQLNPSLREETSTRLEQALFQQALFVPDWNKNYLFEMDHFLEKEKERLYIHSSNGISRSPEPTYQKLA